MFGQSHLDQVAPAADSLENVLDVVRERGDGLPDGGEAFGLDHRGVVTRVFHGQCRLVRDGDHQFQVVFVEAMRGVLYERVDGRSRGVDVDHAHQVIAALHGHADRLADSCADDARRRIPAVVLLGVAGNHALALFHYIVEDRLADRHPLWRPGVAPHPLDFRLELPGLGTDQHDAAAVGFDEFEDQLHDAMQQLVDVQSVADGQSGAIHELQIAPRTCQPGALGNVGGDLEEMAALFLGDGMHDVGLIAELAIGRDRDLVTQVDQGAGGALGVEHQRAADLDLVAALQAMGLDRSPIDECAVGAVQVADRVDVAGCVNLGMTPGDFRVVELDAVR